MLRNSDLNDAIDALSGVQNELRDMNGRVPMDLADNYTQMVMEVDAVIPADVEESEEESAEESVEE